jgi:hypothetical protein
MKIHYNKLKRNVFHQSIIHLDDRPNDFLFFDQLKSFVCLFVVKL